MDLRQELDRAIDELRPIDDIFLRVLFHNNKRLVSKILRIIMDKPDLKVLKYETPYDIEQITIHESADLYASAIDCPGTLYNIEVQINTGVANPRRSRYHHALIDIDSLKANGRCDKLPESYVIFITDKDEIGDGAPIHVFKMYDEKTNTSLNDGIYTIYLNTGYTGDFGESALTRLLHDFKCSQSWSMLTSFMKESVRSTKCGERRIYMCEIIDNLIKAATEEKDKSIAEKDAEIEQLKKALEEANSKKKKK